MMITISEPMTEDTIDGFVRAVGEVLSETDEDVAAAAEVAVPARL